MMKYVLGFIALVVVLVAVALGVLWVKRTVNNMTTPIDVTEVEPGIHCATAVTSDGVAMDCYEYPPR
jgi:hypothetical protein